MPGETYTTIQQLGGSSFLMHAHVHTCTDTYNVRPGHTDTNIVALMPHSQLTFLNITLQPVSFLGLFTPLCVFDARHPICDCEQTGCGSLFSPNPSHWRHREKESLLHASYYNSHIQHYVQDIFSSTYMSIYPSLSPSLSPGCTRIHSKISSISWLGNVTQESWSILGAFDMQISFFIFL